MCSRPRSCDWCCWPSPALGQQVWGVFLWAWGPAAFLHSRRAFRLGWTAACVHQGPWSMAGLPSFPDFLVLSPLTYSFPSQENLAICKQGELPAGWAQRLVCGAGPCPGLLPQLPTWFPFQAAGIPQWAAEALSLGGPCHLGAPALLHVTQGVHVCVLHGCWGFLRAGSSPSLTPSPAQRQRPHVAMDGERASRGGAVGVWDWQLSRCGR